MKVCINDDTYIIYLNKYFTNNFDFENHISLEECFRDIFLKLNNFYNIKVGGYYEVCVYIDNNYGAILEIVKDIDYELMPKEIDMRITISKNQGFLYELDDIFTIDNSMQRKCTIYKYKHQFYLEINKQVTDYYLGSILEQAEIIYGHQVTTIKKYGTIINITTTALT